MGVRNAIKNLKKGQIKAKPMERRNDMLKKSHGPCVSKERCVEILTEEIEDLLPEEKWKDYERSVNRVMYEFDKLDGVKPRYNRGKHIKSWYTCRNCGSTVMIHHNFCPNCGYKLLWDGIRCLTK